jgi:hypothetical protein
MFWLNVSAVLKKICGTPLYVRADPDIVDVKSNQ